VSLKRIIGIVFVACALAGCTDADWDHLLSFDKPSSTPVATADASQAIAAPTDVAAPPPSDSAVAMAPQPSYSVTQTITTVTRAVPSNPAVGYCRSMAQNTGSVATRDGMDSQGQQQAADATYNECLSLYGASSQ
jgi:hypothetical protein